MRTTPLAATLRQIEFSLPEYCEPNEALLVDNPEWDLAKIYEKTGIASDGTVLGHFRATGIRPKFVQRLKVFGIDVPDEIFDPTRTYE